MLACTRMCVGDRSLLFGEPVALRCPLVPAPSPTLFLATAFFPAPSRAWIWSGFLPSLGFAGITNERNNSTTSFSGELD